MKLSRTIQARVGMAITRPAALYALLAVTSTSAVACSMAHDTGDAADVGGMRIALKSQARNGRQYNLRNAVFTITGPNGAQTVLNSNTGDVVQTQLAAGSYNVALSGMYSLEELQPDMSAVPVPATLQSPLTQPFDVVPPNMTDVAFNFVVGAMDVQFGYGGVNVGFTVSNCNSGDVRNVACTAGGTRTDTCVNGDWQQGAGCFDYLGEGECRQKDGNYAMNFSIAYQDLSPHTDGDHAQQAEARCKATCFQHSDWCDAAMVVRNSYWPAPECWLVTDIATFEASGQMLQNNTWGGSQIIDGMSYQTYCDGSGDCEHTNWDGGSFGAREGWFCYVLKK